MIAPITVLGNLEDLREQVNRLEGNTLSASLWELDFNMVHARYHCSWLCIMLELHWGR